MWLLSLAVRSGLVHEVNVLLIWILCVCAAFVRLTLASFSYPSWDIAMSLNFTIDDDYAVLAYGPGWGVESPNDATLDNYFQSTYHASQTFGANVNLTFSGIAIYLFGSKGPSHGNFSVRYDNLVQLLSAQADTPSYRQLLFSAQFLAGDHSITLTNTDNNHSWLDLDFLTVTAAGNTSLPKFSSTISPFSIVPTSTHVSSASSASSSSIIEPSSHSNIKINDATLVVSITLGVFLFFLVVVVVWYLVCRTQCWRHKPSPHPYGADAGSSTFRRQQPNTDAFPPHPSTYDASPLGVSRTGANSVSKNASKRRSEIWQRGNYTPTAAPTGSAARPWSPFSTPLSRIFSGTAKEGADSMKSTFLKV